MSQLSVLSDFLTVTGGCVYQVIYDYENGDSITDTVFFVEKTKQKHNIKSIYEPQTVAHYENRVRKVVETHSSIKGNTLCRCFSIFFLLKH